MSAGYSLWRRCGFVEGEFGMKIFRGHKGDIHCAFIPSPYQSPFLQDRLFTSGYDQTIKIWNLQTNSLIQTLSGHTSIIKTLSLISTPLPSSSDTTTSSFLVSGSWDNTLRIWQIPAGRCLHVIQGHDNRIKIVQTFHGRHSQHQCFYILSGGDDCLMKLWIYYPENNSSFLLGNYEGHQQPIISLALSYPSYGSQKRQIASGSADNTIRIWDLHSSSLNHDSSIAETTANSSTANTESTRTYSSKLTLTGHRGPVNTVVFSLIEETKQLFSCSDDSSLLVWDYESGYIIRQLFGHQAAVTSLVNLFRDDNEFLLSVSRDGTLRIWNSKTTSELKKIDCNPSSNSGPSLCPPLPLLSLSLRENEISGTAIALGGSDGSLRLIPRLEDHYLGLGMSGIGLRVNTQSGEQISSISKVQFIPKTRVLKNLVVGGYDPSSSLSSSSSSPYVQSSDSSHLLPKITTQKRLNGGKPLKSSHSSSSSPSKQQQARAMGAAVGEWNGNEDSLQSSRSSTSVTASQSSNPIPSVRSSHAKTSIAMALPRQRESNLHHTLQLKSAAAAAPLLSSSHDRIRGDAVDVDMDIAHDGRAYRIPSDCLSDFDSASHSAATCAPTDSDPSPPLVSGTERGTGTERSHRRGNTNAVRGRGGRGSRMKPLPQCYPRKKEFILTVSLYSEPVVLVPKEQDKMLRVLSYAPSPVVAIPPLKDPSA